MGDSLTVKLAALTRAFPVRIWVPQPIRLLTPAVRATENLSVYPVSVWSAMPVHEIDPSVTSPEVVVLIVGAGAPVTCAPAPITVSDNTSGFNGIAVYDLKY